MAAASRWFHFGFTGLGAGRRRGSRGHDVASPGCAGPLRSAMNNSETDISGQNPNLVQVISTIRRLPPIGALERLAPHKRSRSGVGEMFCEADSRQAQLLFVQGCHSRGSAIQRTRLRNEGLEGFEFTFDQRTDAKMAMAVLAGSGLSLTQAAKIANRRK